MNVTLGDRFVITTDEGNGSFMFALRLMSMFFLFNPASLLAGSWLGRMPLLLMVSAPGFFGGLVARSTVKALTAAFIVAAAYISFGYMLAFAFLNFLTMLPKVGAPVEAAMGLVGGIAISAALIVAACALPLTLLLVITSYIGVLASNISVDKKSGSESVGHSANGGISGYIPEDHGMPWSFTPCEVCGSEEGWNCACGSPLDDFLPEDYR